jgi:hypothetical protein
MSIPEDCVKGAACHPLRALRRISRWSIGNLLRIDAPAFTCAHRPRNISKSDAIDAELMG